MAEWPVKQVEGLIGPRKYTIEPISSMLDVLPALARPCTEMSQPQTSSKPRSAAAAQWGTTNLVPLLAAMAAEDQEALGKLYDLTSALVHGVALRMLENAHDAEEVVLDVYMKAWRNASQYSTERGSVPAWLVMMTRTVAIDRMRTRKAQPRSMYEDAFPIPEPVATKANPEEATVQSEWRDRIRSAISELPAEQREALVLAYFGGLSHAALAERLQQPLGTVKTRIRLGLKRMRSLLGENAVIA